MADLSKLLYDLAVANRVLASEGVVDAMGHVSIRHPERADRFFLSCSRSPELVVRDDLMEYDLDCNPIDQQGRPMYFERPIHGAIYQARPDVMSVIHNHSYELIPFSVTSTQLRPLINLAGPMGLHVPVWDIRTNFGDTDMLVASIDQGLDLARTLGKGRAALMRGHGCVVAAPSLREAVQLAIYMKVNAKLQAEAMRLGAVTFLTEGELARSLRIVTGSAGLNRMWEYWTRRADIDNV